MKKKLLCILLIAMALITLSGCTHKHKLLDATCTEPIRCKRCDYTQGIPLDHKFTGTTCTEEGTCERCGEKRPAYGHIYAAATCQRPMTCTRCGETSGSIIDHDYHEANLQFGEKCSMCGDERTAKLEGDFEKAGIECKVVLGQEYEMPTRTLENANKETTPTVCFSDFKVLEKAPEISDGTIASVAPNGYVWVMATATIKSTDENGAAYGVNYYTICEDYYDVIKHDGTLSCNDQGIYEYTVNYDGIDYDKCMVYTETVDNWTIGVGGTTTVNFYICEPKDYDGAVIGLIDARTQWDEADKITDVYDESIMLYRLPKASIAK